jgi:hypothetical protein
VRCVSVYPKGILGYYDESKAAVKLEFARSLSRVCLRYCAECAREETNYHTACWAGAVEHRCKVVLFIKEKTNSQERGTKEHAREHGGAIALVEEGL